MTQTCETVVHPDLQGLQQPLYSKEAEQAVIGALLLDNILIEKLDFLQSEHFYVGLNGLIFTKIRKAHKNMFAITCETIIEEVIPGKEIDETTNIHNHIRNCFNSATLAVSPEGLARVILDLCHKRQIVEASKQTISDISINKREDSASVLIEEAQNRLFRISQDGDYKKDFERFDSLVSRSVMTIEENYKNQKKTLGLTTGFVDLDKLLGGLQKSDLIIIAARPSMGKTALAINMAVNAAHDIREKNEGIAFFSLEMSSEQITNRIISMHTGINSFDMRSGRINQSQFDIIMRKYRELSSLQLFIDDTAGLGVMSLRSRARRLAGKIPLRAIFVDYLQLLKGSSHASVNNRVVEISEITQELKAIAKELDIPVVALSQLSRAVEQREDKRPLLSDLRESGSIEQDADLVMFIYREEYYTRRSQPREGTEEHRKWQNNMDAIMNQAEIMIAKQRNGPIGNVKLFYDSNATVFRDML